MAHVITLYNSEEEAVWRGIAAQQPTTSMQHELWQQGYSFWSVDGGWRQSLETPQSEYELEEEAFLIKVLGFLTVGTGLPASIMWALDFPGLQFVVLTLAVTAMIAFTAWAVVSARRCVRNRILPQATAAKSSFFTQQHVLPLSEDQQDMLAWAVETEANMRSPIKRIATEVLLGHGAVPTCLNDWYDLWGDQAYRLARDITEDAELQRLYDVSLRLTSSTSRGVHSFALSLRQAAQYGRTVTGAAERVRGHYLASQQVEQAAIDALDNRPELGR